MNSTHGSLSLRGAILMTCVGVASCLPDGLTKHRGPVTPEQLDDGWPIASPERVEFDPSVLGSIHEDLLREDRHFGALAFLVAKDGNLVFETYLRDPSDRDLVQHIQSATKSVTSLAFGLARDRGLFPDLSSRLDSIFPEELAGLGEERASITIEDLLTMRSGLSFDNRDFSMEMWVDRPDRPLRYILEKPMYAEHGASFFYRDMDPQLLGYAMQRRTGQREEDWVRQNLFKPLAIDDYYWENGDDVTLAAHGLHLKPRDMLKIGQLLLNQGAWHGQQVVSPEWIELATSTKVPRAPTQWIPENTGYGYYFWVWESHRAFTAAGHGGQFILVVPDKRMVIVQVSLPDSDDLQGAPLRDFQELVSPLL